MLNYYNISFKKEGKQYIFKSNESFVKDDVIVVETEKGLQFGYVMSKFDESKLKISKDIIKSIVRKISDEDQKTFDKNFDDAKKALIKASELAKKLGLEMKFVDCSFTLDRKQLLLNYVSENRVDFRELAKSLASIYRTRIELRQIGVRDKAKEIGGYGPCGRKLCCSGFLSSMSSVSMNMAKNQNIALNPNKINGCCGRLMCCLGYEDDEYVRCSKGMPRVGQKINNNGDSGKVVSVDILNRKYVIDINGESREVVLEDCEKCKKY